MLELFTRICTHVRFPVYIDINPLFIIIARSLLLNNFHFYIIFFHLSHQFLHHFNIILSHYGTNNDQNVERKFNNCTVRASDLICRFWLEPRKQIKIRTSNPVIESILFNVHKCWLHLDTFAPNVLSR